MKFVEGCKFIRRHFASEAEYIVQLHGLIDPDDAHFIEPAGDELAFVFARIGFFPRRFRNENPRLVDFIDAFKVAREVYVVASP